MVAHGHVENGVIVLDGDVSLPEGQKVTVVTPALEEDNGTVAPSQERQKALPELIGIWKTDNPPTDAEVDQIIDEARMKKYG
ncbi:MAG: hypothetical protein FJ303_06155 [Planctomycetes bacterium]|nr:hypothetical protein [Planctomycetota bacterium]